MTAIYKQERYARYKETDSSSSFFRIISQTNLFRRIREKNRFNSYGIVPDVEIRFFFFPPNYSYRNVQFFFSYTAPCIK